MGPLPPTRSNSRSCKHAQEHDLGLGREFADLVEEERAAVGQLEATLASLQRSREGALLVAEELRRDERRRDRGAIHGDERPGRAGGSLVDRPGDELLARAGLPGDEHGGIGRRHLGHVRQDHPERPRSADDLLEHRRAIDLLAQREILASDAVVGALAIVDIGSGGIPADDRAVVVANRVVADQEPAILSVAAARAQLGFKRLTAHERPAAVRLGPRHIIRVEAPDVRIIGSDLFEAEPGVVEHEGIRAERRTIRPQDGDGVGNGVECSPELFVGGGKVPSPLRCDHRREVEAGGRRSPQPRRPIWRILEARAHELGVVAQDIEHSVW